MRNPAPFSTTRPRMGLLALLALLLSPLAGPTPTAMAASAAQDGPVTVTLVRWPYT